MKKILFITSLICIFTFVCGCAAKDNAESNVPETVQSDVRDTASEVPPQNNSSENESETQDSSEKTGGLASMEQFAQSKEVTGIIDEFSKNNPDIDFELSVEENGSRLVCTANYNNSSLDGDDGVKIYRVMEPLVQQAWEEAGGVPSLNTPEFELKCYSDDGRFVYDHSADLGASDGN